MMNEFIFWVLCLICILILSEGLLITRKIYQYPFFMAGIFIGFILPQAAGLVYGVANVPEIAVRRVLIMSCLCVSMCWLGYQVIPPRCFLKRSRLNLNKTLNKNRVILIAILYVLLSFVFWFFIFTLPNGYGLRLSGTSTGIFTIYLFFARILTNIGFLLILLELIENPRISVFF